MSDQFFSRLILNLPYRYPRRNWQLAEDDQPTQTIIEYRRIADFITAILKPKHQMGSVLRKDFLFDEGHGLTRDIESRIRRV